MAKKRPAGVRRSGLSRDQRRALRAAELTALTYTSPVARPPQVMSSVVRAVAEAAIAAGADAAPQLEAMARARRIADEVEIREEVERRRNAARQGTSGRPRKVTPEDINRAFDAAPGAKVRTVAKQLGVDERTVRRHRPR
jgi:hypothetical protein